MELIEEWRQAGRMWSVRLIGLASSLQATWLLVLTPAQRALVESRVGEETVQWIVLLLTVLAGGSRVVKQKRLRRPAKPKGAQ